MVGEIETRRKKGRPSKADLARRAAAEVRRSSRRRNVVYNFDDDDDYEEGEELRRREKKLKVLLGGASRRVGHAPPESDDDAVADEIDDETMGEKSGGGDSSAEASVRERKAGSNDADYVPGTPPDLPTGVPLPDKETLELILDKLQKKDTYGVYAEPVDPDELPDYHGVIEHPMDFATVRKKLGKGSYTTLEKFESDVLLICSNAMQYNAPDTIYYKQAFSIQELAQRKFQRLRFGDEQNEKELQSEQKPTSISLGTNRQTRTPITRVAPETIASDYEKLQSEQKLTSNSLGTNRQIQTPITRVAPETVASDFTSAVSLATSGDLQPGLTTRASGIGRLSNVDESVGGTAAQSENNLDKTEDLPSGRGHISKFGRKPLAHYDNHRATYNISSQLVPESSFSTFDDEIKQLLAVGLHADHSYARSLSRFAATLGPVAWKVASKRIEQALPPGIKFGRGWVGDYEPISTPVLVVKKCSQKESFSCEELNISSNPNKDVKIFETARSVYKNPIVPPTSQGKSTLLRAAINSTGSPASNVFPSISQPLMEEMLDVKPNIAASLSYQVQNPRARSTQPEKKVNKRVELNSTPPADQSPREIWSPSTKMSGSKSTEMEPLSRDMNHPVSLPLKQPQNNGFVELSNGKLRNYDQRPLEFSSVKQIPGGTSMLGSKLPEPLSWDMSHPIAVPLKQPQNNGSVEVTNGKSRNNNFDINRTITPVNNDSNHMCMPANYFPHGHDQGLTEPVHVMRRLTENAQKQQKHINHSTTDNTLVPSSTKEEPSNASSAAARAWMSIGAGSPKSVAENTSIRNRSQIFVNSPHSPMQVSRFRNDSPVSGMQFHPVNNNFNIQGFLAPQFRTGNEAQFQNLPQMVFPQLVATDLSRFQMQSSPRQGQYLQRQPSQKQETTIPPDLNLVFQSSGSPGRQSSGLQVDSQQPDLALQL